jgi:hypothetical protein
MDDAFAQARWIPAIQNDFAARADWCIKDFKNANHAPKVSVKEGNFIKVKAGQEIKLNIKISDPDENKVKYFGWCYLDVSTSFLETINTDFIKNQISVKIPNSAKVGDKVHLIIEASDDGIPSLTCYQRVVFTVK